MKIKLALVSMVLLLLTSCASYNPVETSRGLDNSIDIEVVEQKLEAIEEEKEAPAGFWYGLLHGAILPFSVLGRALGNDIGVYETYNTGNWYNFGFFLGVGLLCGSSASSSD